MHVSPIYHILQCELRILFQVRDTLYGADPHGVTEATREGIKKFLGHARQAEAKDAIYMLFIVSNF